MCNEWACQHGPKPRQRPWKGITVHLEVIARVNHACDSTTQLDEHHRPQQHDMVCVRVCVMQKTLEAAVVQHQQGLNPEHGISGILSSGLKLATGNQAARLRHSRRIGVAGFLVA